MAVERERGISVSSAVMSFEHQGADPFDPLARVSICGTSRQRIRRVYR